MIFTETKLSGAFIIDLEKVEDERGFFARTWCRREFAAIGLNPCFVQCNLSFNNKKHTLRGMHYQKAPYQEAKLVSCPRGAIYDVIIDIRPGSPTYKEWMAVELTGYNHRMIYIPEGYAHGFQTLEDDTEVFYQMSEIYVPECARGIRWNDSAFNISWPYPPESMSLKDQQYQDFNE